MTSALVLQAAPGRLTKRLSPAPTGIIAEGYDKAWEFHPTSVPLADIDHLGALVATLADMPDRAIVRGGLTPFGAAEVAGRSADPPAAAGSPRLSGDPDGCPSALVNAGFRQLPGIDR